MHDIHRMTKVDFDEILGGLTDFWGPRADDVTGLHHPMFFYEFGDSAFVVRRAGRVAGYLFGVVAQTGPVGYVHTVAVRTGCRRQGIGGALCARFEKFARGRGCRALKCIAPPGDLEALAFHMSQGMRLLGPPDNQGTPIVENYGGGDWMVLWKELIDESVSAEHLGLV